MQRKFKPQEPKPEQEEPNMEARSFGSILDRPPSETERPRPLPPGTYHCMIRQRPVWGESAVKKTEFVEFRLNPIATVGKTVSEEDLDSYLTKADGSKRVLSDASIRATYYLTDNALWRLDKFLRDDLLISDLDEIGYRQAIDGTLNREVLAEVRHKPSDDGTAVFAQLVATAPVSE